MDDLVPFAHVVLVVAVTMVLAVGSNRLAERLHVPAPALFLVAAAVASDLVPRLETVPIITDQRIVTVALALILFDGGMHIGWGRMRPALVHERADALGVVVGYFEIVHEWHQLQRAQGVGDVVAVERRGAEP